MGLVYGVGIYEKGKYTATEGRKITRGYQLWRGMLKRCYCENDLKRYPTYIGYTVSEEFKNFQKFMDWAVLQKGFNEDKYQLDKDILYNPSRQYNRDTAVFVPPEINMFFAYENRAKREGIPCGVSFVNHRHKNKVYTTIQSHINENGKRKRLGYFETVEDAAEAYLQAKIKQAKDLAIKYSGQVDIRVINVLNNFNSINRK